MKKEIYFSFTRWFINGLQNYISDIYKTRLDEMIWMVWTWKTERFSVDTNKQNLIGFLALPISSTQKRKDAFILNDVDERCVQSSYLYNYVIGRPLTKDNENDERFFIIPREGSQCSFILVSVSGQAYFLPLCHIFK